MIYLTLLTSDDVVGTWTLTNQGGARYDICNGETGYLYFFHSYSYLSGSSPITKITLLRGGVLYTEYRNELCYSVSSSTGSTKVINVNKEETVENPFLSIQSSQQISKAQAVNKRAVQITLKFIGGQIIMKRYYKFYP